MSFIHKNIPRSYLDFYLIITGYLLYIIDYLADRLIGEIGISKPACFKASKYFARNAL